MVHVLEFVERRIRCTAIELDKSKRLAYKSGATPKWLFGLEPDQARVGAFRS